MSQHIALFHLAPTSLLVRGEVLGKSYYLERNGLGALLTVPESEGDFGPVGEDHPQGEGLVPVYHWNQDTGEVLGAVAKVIQVAVLVHSTASSDEDTEDGRTEGSRALTEGLRAAVAIVEEFIAWMRTEGQQPWVGPSHESVD